MIAVISHLVPWCMFGFCLFVFLSTVDFNYQYSRVPPFLVCDLVFDFLPRCSSSMTTHCPHSSSKLILLHVVAGIWVSIKKKELKNIANNTLYLSPHLLNLFLHHLVTLYWDLILHFTHQDFMQLYIHTYCLQCCKHVYTTDTQWRISTLYRRM